MLKTPASVVTDAAGNLVIADSANNRIRVVAATSGTFYGQAMTAGDIYTVAGNGTFGFAGDGGPAASAELRDPTGSHGRRLREPAHLRLPQRAGPAGRGHLGDVLRHRP